jgi:signal transduction histidine kinase
VLVLDVTHDRRREQALGEAEREARRANDLKDQFLATLSHELRTPLNAILGYARMARAGVVPPGRAVEVIERNARLQARLVEDLLDVSRMVSGKLQFEMGEVDLAAVVGDVVDMLRSLADSKLVRLAAELPPEATSAIAGDGARLRQMLVNLVSNAVKFTPEGGRVVVRLAVRDGSVEVSVQDSGIGIDHALLPVVFDRFRQADSSATREHGGLGLGLSIAKTIAEAHGGTVAAASAGLGCGATFTVTLPVSVPALRQAGARAS